MNILITTAEWKSALTCMRSLGRRGHRISLISHDPYVPALYSKFCKEIIISPIEKHKTQYLEFVIQLIQKGKYDLLVPISDLCIEYFSGIREELSKYTKILLPTIEAIEIARNKGKTYRFAYANNIPIPKTYFPDTIIDVEDISKAIAFPCVVKMQKGTGGRGNTYINNSRDLIALFNALNKQDGWPVIQEFIKGKFCGFTAVCDRGEVLDFFMFEVVRQYPENGGITVYANSFYDKQAFDISSDIIRKLSWTGPIDLDFFMMDGRSFVLIEINPRFSGTTQFAYSCGIDLPYRYFELAFGKAHTPTKKRYKNGLRYRSIFPEEINSCKENKKYIPEFFLKFLYPNTYYDFFLDDPRLLLWQLKAARGDIIK